MKDVFLTVKDKIATVTEVRFYDWDLGQFSDTPPPVSWPAVLFDYNEATFEDLSGQTQLATVQFTLTCGFKLYERTHNLVDDTVLNNSLAHLDVLKKIHLAVQGASGMCSAGYRRVSMRKDKRADYRIYEMTYEAVVEEGPDVLDYNPLPDDVKAKFCYSVQLKGPGED